LKNSMGGTILSVPIRMGRATPEGGFQIMTMVARLETVAGKEFTSTVQKGRVPFSIQAANLDTLVLIVNPCETRLSDNSRFATPNE
jgi:hypothetical protein